MRTPAKTPADVAPGVPAWGGCEHGWRRSRAQPRGQKTAGVALEDQQRVIHVLTVGAVEETQLLLTEGGIVGGI